MPRPIRIREQIRSDQITFDSQIRRSEEDSLSARALGCSSARALERSGKKTWLGSERVGVSAQGDPDVALMAAAKLIES